MCTQNISLRDHFAMHAPAPAPDFNASTHNPEPKVPEKLDLTKQEKKYYKKWYVKEQSEWRPGRPSGFEYLAAKIAAYEETWMEYCRKMNAYELGKECPELARITEWRYAYADMMLAERQLNMDIECKK